MTTIHIAIGNSDNKLTQAEWANYYKAVDVLVGEFTGLVDGQWAQLYGRWASLPTAQHQNACWAFDEPLGFEKMETLIRRLAQIANHYHQESIALNRSETEFITPGMRE